jgi:hypothetical protein
MPYATSFNPHTTAAFSPLLWNWVFGTARIPMPEGRTAFVQANKLKNAEGEVSEIAVMLQLQGEEEMLLITLQPSDFPTCSVGRTFFVVQTAVTWYGIPMAVEIAGWTLEFSQSWVTRNRDFHLYKHSSSSNAWCIRPLSHDAMDIVGNSTIPHVGTHVSAKQYLKTVAPKLDNRIFAPSPMYRILGAAIPIYLERSDKGWYCWTDMGITQDKSLTGAPAYARDAVVAMGVCGCYPTRKAALETLSEAIVACSPSLDL